MKNFVLIGAGGYVAPRHMKAIRDTNNNLLAALDKHDSVGVLDNYFPSTDFFTEFERFDRHIEKLKRQGIRTDFVSICSPNYLHDAHIRFGLRIGADVVCEKPIVINPWNIDPLVEMEKETGRKIYTILQLRLHPAIQALKQKITNAPTDKKYDVQLRYISCKGNWYHNSWKGDVQKSGGIATNIGIHFFDMLLWLFGNVVENTVTQSNSKTMAGKLVLQKASVDWILSIDSASLPPDIAHDGKRIFRSMIINGEAIDFSEGFGDLHTRSYEEILAGRGFSINEAKDTISLLYGIRQQADNK